MGMKTKTAGVAYAAAFLLAGDGQLRTAYAFTHSLRSQRNILTTRSMTGTTLVESSEEKATTREETLHSFGSGLSMTERKFDWT
jgi:hypothetical protein